MVNDILKEALPSHLNGDELLQASSGDLEFPCKGYIPPAIPDGDHYEAVFVRAEKKRLWGQPKVFLWFKLMTPGEWVNHEFWMACNLPPRDHYTPSYKFWLVWVLAAGRRPRRADRMSTKVFRNKLFRVRIRKVVKTAKQIDRTLEQQYSVVDELLEIRVGR